MWDLPPPDVSRRPTRSIKPRRLKGDRLFVALLRRLPWQWAAREGYDYDTAPPSRGSARSSRSPRSAPTRAAGPPTPRTSRPPRTSSMRAIPGASTVSTRPRVTPTIRSTASGRARPICTTARCRRCATCWSRALGGPAVWYRGSDELDLVKVGYRSDAAAPGGPLFRYDTSRPGNANAGHDGPRYGTDLPDRREGRHRRIYEDAMTQRRSLSKWKTRHAIVVGSASF